MDAYLNRNLLSEEDIWELIRSNDKDAFNTIYHRYWQDLYKISYTILRDREQSMDIVQEVFIWLWQHRAQLIIKTSLKGYLLAAVKFKTANCIRNGKIREGFFKQIKAVQILENNNAAGLNVEIKELEDVIRQTINLLPDRCKTVYRLSRNEDLSNKEIAGQLGISVKTVENQMTIALRRLRAAVTQLFLFLIIFFFC